MRNLRNQISILLKCMFRKLVPATFCNVHEPKYTVSKQENTAYLFKGELVCIRVDVEKDINRSMLFKIYHGITLGAHYIILQNPSKR